MRFTDLAYLFLFVIGLLFYASSAVFAVKGWLRDTPNGVERFQARMVSCLLLLPGTFLMFITLFHGTQGVIGFLYRFAIYWIILWRVGHWYKKREEAAGR